MSLVHLICRAECPERTVETAFTLRPWLRRWLIHWSAQPIGRVVIAGDETPIEFSIEILFGGATNSLDFLLHQLDEVTNFRKFTESTKKRWFITVQFKWNRLLTDHLQVYPHPSELHPWSHRTTFGLISRPTLLNHKIYLSGPSWPSFARCRRSRRFLSTNRVAFCIDPHFSPPNRPARMTNPGNNGTNKWRKFR